MDYRGFRLDRFQEEAITHINDGRSVLVSAPTGTGKTLIADYLIEEILESGREVIYTAPVKALSNQKYRQYTRLFGADKVGLVTGDIVINRDAPVRIMTTEILRNMLLQGPPEVEAHLTDSERGEFLETAPPSNTHMPEISRLAAVIVDEIHFVDDNDRGTVWEELLIYLPPEVRILGLSATLSNLDDFAGWLSAIRGEKVEVVWEYERAVPLNVSLANAEAGIVDVKTFERGYKQYKREEKKERKQSRGRDRGRHHRPKRSRHSDVFRALDLDMLPALYFIYSRKMTEQLSFDLSRSNLGSRIGKRGDRNAIRDVLSRFEKEHPDVLTTALRKLLSNGIAYHHAGLHVALKSLVEELYESRLIQVLYCTSTFALGINMPARTVVFDSLTKYNGVEIVPISVREFMQMAGRAGRRGIDEVGDAIVKLDYFDYKEVEETLGEVLAGKSEPVSSSFNLSFNSVVNLIDRYSEEQIQTILEKSFKAYQNVRLAEELEAELEKLQAKTSEDQSRRERRRLAYLKRRISDASRPQLWEHFQRKVQFLRSHGYLEADNSLNGPARILKRIQFEEVFITELVLDGVVDQLAAEELFGVMCGLVLTLPRTARVSKPEDEKWWTIFDKVGRVRDSDIVVGAEELVGGEFTFTPEMMPLGEAWAKGESLSQILDKISNPTDLSGDLVGAFRRAKDLVGQIRNVYEEDEERRRELTHVLRAVTRDEVEVID